jgi:hypothetical protein
VALAAIKGDRTLAQLAEQFDVTGSIVIGAADSSIAQSSGCSSWRSWRK